MFRELKSFPSLRNSQSSQFPKIPNFISKIVPVRKPRKVFYAHATCVGRSRLSIFDSIPMASSLAFEPTLESSPSPALRCLDTFGMGSFSWLLHAEIAPENTTSADPDYHPTSYRRRRGPERRRSRGRTRTTRRTGRRR